MADKTHSRIVIVDDEQDFLDNLVEFFNGRGFDARGVLDGQALDAALEERGADLVILDLLLPGEGGLDIGRRLRHQGNIGILMLTCLKEGADQIKAGADAYLPKESDLMVIEATAHSILQQVFAETSQAKTGRGVWVLEKVQWTLTAPGGESVKLTKTELSVLSRLLKRPGKVINRSEIVSCLGRTNTEANRRNLDTLVRRLRKKVEDKTGASLPLAASYGSGYAFTSGASVVGA